MYLLVSIPDNEKSVSAAGQGRGLFGKLTSMYSSRHNLSDAEKAVFFVFVFMLVTILVSIGFAMLLGK